MRYKLRVKPLEIQRKKERHYHTADFSVLGTKLATRNFVVAVWLRRLEINLMLTKSGFGFSNSTDKRSTGSSHDWILSDGTLRTDNTIDLHFQDGPIVRGSLLRLNHGRREIEDGTGAHRRAATSGRDTGHRGCTVTFIEISIVVM